MSSNRKLYITLQYIYTENGQNKYHWGLFASSDEPPKGTMYHATDVGRAPLDLYYESRAVLDPLKSVKMIVCLAIAPAPSQSAIDNCVREVPLMRRSKLPVGEARWTCRVWVKEALKYLHRYQIIRLPDTVDMIEYWCQYRADAYLPYRGQMGIPMIYHNLGWMSRSNNRTTPMEIDSTQYYESKPMVTNPNAYYGLEPMAIDSTRNYGSKPMDTEEDWGSARRHQGHH